MKYLPKFRWSHLSEKMGKCIPEEELISLIERERERERERGGGANVYRRLMVVSNCLF